MSPSPEQNEDLVLHKRINAFGKKLSVIRLDGVDYLIGVQIASLLRRETFNMYRSMKIKNIHIKRANPDHVEYLCKCNAVRPGTHSVTLIPYESGLYFVAEAWFKQHKAEGFPYNKPFKYPANIVRDKLKLHRRKAYPWDVYRSIRKGDLDSSKETKFMDLDSSTEDININNFGVPTREDIIESLLFAADSLSDTNVSSEQSDSFSNAFTLSFQGREVQAPLCF